MSDEELWALRYRLRRWRIQRMPWLQRRNERVGAARLKRGAFTLGVVLALVPALTRGSEPEPSRSVAYAGSPDAPNPTPRRTAMDTRHTPVLASGAAAAAR